MAKIKKTSLPVFLSEYEKIGTGFSVKQLGVQTSVTIFQELKTLESIKIPFKKFCGFFKVDKRYPAAAFQRFIMLNKKAFSFLNIKPSFEDDGDTLVLTSSQYVGCIPIKSPVDGKISFNLSLIAFFKMVVFALDVFRLKKSSGIWIFRYGYLGVGLKIWCFVRKVS